MLLVLEPEETSFSFLWTKYDFKRVLKKNGFRETMRFHRDRFIPGSGFVGEKYYEAFNPDFR
jgi:hypothetical protein